MANTSVVYPYNPDGEKGHEHEYDWDAIRKSYEEWERRYFEAFCAHLKREGLEAGSGNNETGDVI